MYQTLSEAPPAGTVLKFRPGEADLQKPYIESDFAAIPLRVVLAGPHVDDQTFRRVRLALDATGFAATPMYRSTATVA